MESAHGEPAAQVVEQSQANVVHFHNTFPLVSPAAYYAAHRAGAAVVQTLHNYRLLCPQATFFREGGICEDCLGKRFAWPGVRRKCYRNSRSATIAVASMLATHRVLGSWRRQVDTFIALSEFSRGKFVQGGLPAEKIVVKPNFVSPDPGLAQAQGQYALFLGRLSPEKGVDVLMRAWTELAGAVPLKIVGGGPLEDDVQDWAARTPGVEAVGRVSSEAVWQVLAQAAFMVLPSTNFEGFPKTIVEAFACGVPVLASRLGAMAELIDAGRTGDHFQAGDASDLARCARRLYTSPALLASMRVAARREYLQNYTAEPNYQMLMRIYDKALAARRPVSARCRRLAAETMK